MEDPDWTRISHASEDDVSPGESAIDEILLRHGIRNHRTKAKWIHQAWTEIEFKELVSRATSVLTPGPESPRVRELRMVDTILRECHGFGVGPKVARLMMIWIPEAGRGLDFRHVIPLDNRWIRALRERGVEIQGSLWNERGYREIEEEVCRAAYDLNILPFLADSAVFGLLDE